jgi:hypothetical protein
MQLSSRDCDREGAVAPRHRGVECRQVSSEHKLRDKIRILYKFGKYHMLAILFFFLAELRVLARQLLYHLSHNSPPPFFTFLIFGIGSCFLLWTVILLFMLPA